MKFGPEIVHLWKISLCRRFCNRQIARIEAGSEWLALHFSGEEWFFVCWSSQGSGCCSADDQTLKSLLREGHTSSLKESCRAHLSGARLREVEQVGKDRILRLRFEKTLGAGFIRPVSLYFESLDRFANLVLCDEKNAVIDAAKIIPAGTRDRTISPPFSYVPPPSVSGDECLGENASVDDVEHIVGFSRSVRRAVQREWDSHPPSFWSDSFRKGYVDGDSFLRLQVLDGNLIAFPVVFREAEELQERDALRASVSFLCDPVVRSVARRVTKSICSLIEREKHRKQRLLDGMLRREMLLLKAPEYRMAGDAILANISSLRKGMEQAMLPYWNEDGSTREIMVSLDPMKSPQDNASLYYSRYAKAKGNPNNVKQSIEDIRESMAELDEQLSLLETVDSSSLLELALEDLRKWLSPKHSPRRGRKGKKSNEHAVKRMEYGNARISIGLSAIGNRMVTLAESLPSDLWLHARDVAGSHVIVRAASVTVGDHVVRFAASLAAYYSRARSSGAVQVIVAEKRFVRPIPGTIAHVRYRNERNVTVSPLYWKEVLEERR